MVALPSRFFSSSFSVHIHSLIKKHILMKNLTSKGYLFAVCIGGGLLP
jgi:hypothetical protein